MMGDPDSHTAMRAVEQRLRIGVAVIKGRWTLPILLHLCVRPTHFAELQRDLGLAHKVLAQALERMRRHGLVVRHAPERVGLKGAYSLTEAGQALRDSLRSLAEWAATYEDQIGLDVRAPRGGDAPGSSNREVTG